MNRTEIVPHILNPTLDEEHPLVTKFKARYEEFKQDSFQQGMVVGGVIGLTSTIIAFRSLGVNLDPKGVYIPDHVIDKLHSAVENTMVASRDGKVVVLTLITETAE